MQRSPVTARLCPGCSQPMTYLSKRREYRCQTEGCRVHWAKLDYKISELIVTSQSAVAEPGYRVLKFKLKEAHPR